MSYSCNGNGSFSGTVNAADFNATSDRKVKENIVPLNASISLNKIKNINGVSFNFIDDENKTNKLGVIAQDIESEFPELVNTSDDKKSVNYNGFVAPFIKCIKELSSQIDELKKEIALLKSN